MKTIAIYLFGIPCILVGSRLAGLDRSLVQEGTNRSVNFVEDTLDMAEKSSPHNGPTFAGLQAMDAQNSPVIDELIAIVVPKMSANVEATTSGIVEKVLVNPNDVVDAGTPLVVLDTQQIESDIRKQHHLTLAYQCKVRQAQATHNQIQAKLKRLEILVEKNLASVDEYSDLQSELPVTAEQIKQFEAEVAASEEEEKKLREMLDRYVVAAPFSGRIKRVIQHSGQHVQQGDVMLEFESSHKQVRALVPTLLSENIHELKFHVEDANGGPVAITVTDIVATGTATGFNEVLFDLNGSIAQQVNQTLAVRVSGDTRLAARLKLNPESALAVR